ncbi:hypothetical protein [Paucibacter sp. Y2R2-4]|uniref:hypothetical protein n=1 Tax=Paucibacter sp. Y2R2-4 TaxID=2893553 RepID=UPI0021E416DC|nr:hypothetical protein [Paucibacter sp. Y2R2-4]MCV2349300.1 hypothetical protein [Paucibacter sp. Y2R2-4]
MGAAIRRASSAAQAGMQTLDERMVEDLRRIYTDAAQQVRAAIEGAAAGAARVKLDQLRGLLERIDHVLDALASARTQLIIDALREAAGLGVEPLTEEGMRAAGGHAGLDAMGHAPHGVLSRMQALEQVDAAVLFTRNFRAADGLNLSDRLWRVDRGAREAIHRGIEQAVVQGWGADQAAQELMMRGQAVPPDTQRAQGAADVGKVVQAGVATLENADSGALANSLRVARTEINRAHGEAYMSGAAAAPGVVGFRFLLSPRHPRVDICDLYAKQNLYGLGPGVYPDRARCPWPPHPNVLSFVVAVFAPEISAADQAGKETTMQALERLGPDLRAGVLGPTKATYFDQGVLTRGMVRATVGAVKRRLKQS